MEVKYLTVREAARIAKISYSHWRKTVQPEFPPGVFQGRLIYRRSDVERYLEQRTTWPQHTNEKTTRGGNTACSITQPQAADELGSPSVRSGRSRNGKQRLRLVPKTTKSEQANPPGFQRPCLKTSEPNI